jgi:hypothetical protein
VGRQSHPHQAHLCQIRAVQRVRTLRWLRTGLPRRRPLILNLQWLLRPMYTRYHQPHPALLLPSETTAVSPHLILAPAHPSSALSKQMWNVTWLLTVSQIARRCEVKTILSVVVADVHRSCISVMLAAIVEWGLVAGVLTGVMSRCLQLSESSLRLVRQFSLMVMWVRTWTTLYCQVVALVAFPSKSPFLYMVVLESSDRR